VLLPDLLCGERVAGGRHGGLPEGDEHPDENGEGEEESAALYLHMIWIIHKPTREVGILL